MDPLSITASVAGILTASVKILGVLTLLHDAPAFVTAIGVEVNHIRIVVAALRKFLDRTRRLPPGRAALIQVDDVVAILTQTVLTFSELEGFVRSTASRSTLLRLRSRISWPWQQAGADRLLNRLQQHKMTLSLVLQIIQCNSDLDAEEFATSLQDQVENQVQGSPDLLKRLEQLEPLPDGIDAKTLSGDLKPTEEQVEDVDTEEEGCPGHASFPQPNFEIIPPSTNIGTGAPALYDISQTADLMDKSPSLTSQKPSIEMPPSRPITTPGMLPRRFEVILSTTRVYNRVRHRGIDDATSITSFRSRGWSVLTGVSLARVSAISVINLPLSDAEVRRFLDLANSKPKKKNRPPPSDIRLDPRRIPRKLDPPALHSTPKIVQDEAASSRADSGQLRVIRELDGLISNPPKSVFAQEVTDDIMEWQAGITGPPDSPYHGGVWLLRIRFEHAYPRVAPEISFTTRIYHPNVDQNGQISLDMLNQPWSSSINMRQVLLRIWLLLYDPQLDIALVPEIAETYTNDRERFDRTAREWTKGYAM